MNPIFLALLVSSWSIFFLRLLQAMRYHRLGAVRTRQIWLQVLLAMIAFTLFGETIEGVIDGYFSGRPVTLLVKSLALLGMFQLHTQALSRIVPKHLPFQALQRLGMATLLTLTLTDVAYALLPWMPLYNFRLEYIGLRDGVMCLFILWIFLPSSLYFWQYEQVTAMKLKHGASIVSCIGYLLASVGSIGAGLLTLVGHTAFTDYLIRAFRPTMYLVAVSFLVMITPSKWLGPWGYPHRLQTYWRLRRIARHLCEMVNQYSLPQQSFLPLNLELATYRTVIFVLDHYALVAETPDGTALREQVQQCIQRSKSYADLVEEMSRIV
jgi:hypothetical protein